MSSIKPKDIMLGLAVAALLLFFYMYATAPDIIYIGGCPEMDPIIEMIEREGYTVLRKEEINGKTTILVRGHRFTGVVEFETIMKYLRY